MLNLNELRKSYEERKRAIAWDETQETDALKSKYKQYRDIADEEFYTQSCVKILEALKSDYDEIQGRSEFTSLELDDKKLNAVIKIYNTLKEVGEGVGKSKLIEAVEQMGGKKMKKAVRIISKGIPQDKEVFSYLATDGPICYLISPILTDRKQMKPLARDLEEKITDLLVHGEASPERGIYIKFSADPDVIKGFLFHKITTREGDKYQKLADSLVEKFIELQPESFKQANLTHKVSKLDFDIMNYLISKSERILYRQVEKISPIDKLKQEGRESYTISEAVEILGISEKGIKMNISAGRLQEHEGNIKTDSMIEYIEKIGKTQQGKKRLKIEPEEMKQAKLETLREIDKYEDVLTSQQLAKVLGVGTNNVVLNLKKFIEHKREGNRLIFYKDSAREFVEERRKTGKGWVR